MRSCKERLKNVRARTVNVEIRGIKWSRGLVLSHTVLTAVTTERYTILSSTMRKHHTVWHKCISAENHDWFAVLLNQTESLGNQLKVDKIFIIHSLTFYEITLLL